MLLFFVIIFFHTVFKSLPFLIDGLDKFAWTAEMKSLLVNGDWFGAHLQTNSISNSLTNLLRFLKNLVASTLDITKQLYV